MNYDIYENLEFYIESCFFSQIMTKNEKKQSKNSTLTNK